jgi:hypothetical protein
MSRHVLPPTLDLNLAHNQSHHGHCHALGLGRLGRLIFGVALGTLFRSNGSSTLALCGRVVLAVAVSGRDEITLEALEGTADEIPWYSRLSHVSG